MIIMVVSLLLFRRRNVVFRSVLLVLLVLLLLVSANTTTANNVTQLTSEEFKNLIDTNYFNVIIDVRTEAEWVTGHISDATWVQLDTITNYNTTKNTTSLQVIFGCEECYVAVYCRSGARAGVAIQSLQAYGFNYLYNGLGVSQWTDAGYTLVNTTSVTPACSELSSSSTTGTCQARNNTNNVTLVDDIAANDDEYYNNNSTDATSSTDRCNPDLDAAADTVVNQTRQVRCGTKNNVTTTTTTNGSAPVAAPTTTGSAQNIGTNGNSGGNSVRSNLIITSIVVVISIQVIGYFLLVL